MADPNYAVPTISAAGIDAVRLLLEQILVELKTLNERLAGRGL